MSQNYPHRKKSLGPITPADVPLEALPVVELTAEQIQQALDLAEQRNATYWRQDGGVVFGDRDALTSHQIGLLGEIAFARLYGLEVDTSVYHRGDDGTDNTLFGATVDIKATATQKMARPELLVRADKDLSADTYVRAHVISWGLRTPDKVSTLSMFPTATTLSRESISARKKSRRS